MKYAGAEGCGQLQAYLQQIGTTFKDRIDQLEQLCAEVQKWIELLQTTGDIHPTQCEDEAFAKAIALLDYYHQQIREVTDETTLSDRTTFEKVFAILAAILDTIQSIEKIHPEDKAKLLEKITEMVADLTAWKEGLAEKIDALRPEIADLSKKVKGAQRNLAGFKNKLFKAVKANRVFEIVIKMARLEHLLQWLEIRSSTGLDITELWAGIIEQHEELSGLIGKIEGLPLPINRSLFSLNQQIADALSQHLELREKENADLRGWLGGVERHLYDIQKSTPEMAEEEQATEADLVMLWQAFQAIKKITGRSELSPGYRPLWEEDNRHLLMHLGLVSRHLKGLGALSRRNHTRLRNSLAALLEGVITWQEQKQGPALHFRRKVGRLEQTACRI